MATNGIGGAVMAAYSAAVLAVYLAKMLLARNVWQGVESTPVRLVCRPGRDSTYGAVRLGPFFCPLLHAKRTALGLCLLLSNRRICCWAELVLKKAPRGT